MVVFLYVSSVSRGTHQPVCCSVSKRDSREIVLTFRDGFFTIRRKGDEGVSSISCTGREEKPVAESFPTGSDTNFPPELFG